MTIDLVTAARKLVTARLDLVPATAPLVRAEVEALRRFFQLLGVRAIDDWPPPDLIDALPFFQQELDRSPNLVGWYTWYWVLRDGAVSASNGSLPSPKRTRRRAGKAELIGCGGFKGPPIDGCIEIGYYVREGHRRQGYASEALRALLAWAVLDPEVAEVVADTGVENVASIGLLEKLGFARVDGGTRPGLIRFAVRAPRDSTARSPDMGGMGFTG